MLIEPLILSIILGLILGGTFKNLSTFCIKGWWLPVTALFLETLAYRFGHLLALTSLWQYGLQLVIYGLLMAFIIRNWDLKAFWMVGVGFLLNGMVILFNGASMPVAVGMAEKYGFHETLSQLTSGEIFGHHVMTAATRLSYLADVIPIPPPYWFPKTISVGDILIDIGLMLLIITAMRGGKKRVC